MPELSVDEEVEEHEEHQGDQPVHNQVQVDNVHLKHIAFEYRVTS